MILHVSFQEKTYLQPRHKTQLLFTQSANWGPLFSKKQGIHRYWLHLLVRNQNDFLKGVGPHDAGGGLSIADLG